MASTDAQAEEQGEDVVGVTLVEDKDEEDEDEMVEEMVAAAKRALTLTSTNDEDLVNKYSELANALFARFQRYGSEDDLDESLSYERKVIDLTPDGHSDRPMYLHNLATTLLTLSGTQADPDKDFLTEAIKLGSSAIQAAGPTHPSLALYQNSLSTSLTTRFERSGDIDDIKEAIRLSRAAVDTAAGVPPNPHIAVFRLTLSNAFRHNQDFDNAVEFARRANEGPFSTNSVRISCQSALGIALMERYDFSGCIKDLEDALTLSSEVMEETPENHPSFAGRQLNLGIAVLRQYERRGDRVDLDKAIHYLYSAAQASPSSQVQKKGYLNLSMALLSRFERTGDVEDAEQAVLVAASAVNLVFPSASHVVQVGELTYVLNLSSALLELYKASGDIKHLHQSIHCASNAVDLAPANHSERPMYLANLSTGLFMRYQRSLDVKDLKDSIDHARAAIGCTPHGHPDRARWCINLGRAIISSTAESDLTLIEEAYSCFREASTSKSTTPITRFDAAKQWATHADTHGRHKDALEAYTIAFDIIPQLVWIGTNILTRQEFLMVASGLGALATACAISCGNMELAVQFFERGRSILWSQMLQLRAEWEPLRKKNPGLADRLVEIADVLERNSLRGYRAAADDPVDAQAPSLAVGTRLQRQAAQEWDVLLTEVRKVEGFSDFLIPPSFDKLRYAAKSGVVVMLNHTSHRCDALILKSPNDGIILVTLGALNSSLMQNIIQKMQLVYRSEKGRHMKEASPVNREDALASVLGSLWEAVGRPVTLRLDKETPHIYWCVNGSFSALPIHAAGFYREGRPTSNSTNLVDSAISSYIPTLSFLLEAQRRPIPCDNFRFLAVGVPAAPGARPLPFVVDELEAIRDIIPGAQLSVFEGSEATVEAVFAALAKSSWVHFACHGLQSSYNRDVFKSFLLLNDGQLQLSKIVETSLLNAQMVFLSACQSAVGDGTLPDEAMHLAGGMLFAGFRGAVGTLWNVMDADGPRMTKNVYRSLVSDPRDLDQGIDPSNPDCSTSPLNLFGAAKAVQYAVRVLRDSGVPLSRWVCWVHFGI